VNTRHCFETQRAVQENIENRNTKKLDSFKMIVDQELCRVKGRLYVCMLSRGDYHVDKEGKKRRDVLASGHVQIRLDEESNQ
jgi:hypothetical protein